MNSSQTNRRYYDDVWSGSAVMNHTEWPVWDTIKNLTNSDSRLLEIGPGTRPRIPVKGSWFLEISKPAKLTIKSAGGKIHRFDIQGRQEFFDLVCAFEVLEHLEDDIGLLEKLNTQMKKDAVLFISVPLYENLWTEWDEMVGHCRRYSPRSLESLLLRSGFNVYMYAEEHFSKSFNGKTVQKLAKLFYDAFPRLGIWLEARIVRVLCWHYRAFMPIKWKKGSLMQIPKSWAGVYVICTKKKGNSKS